MRIGRPAVGGGRRRDADARALQCPVAFLLQPPISAPACIWHARQLQCTYHCAPRPSGCQRPARSHLSAAAVPQGEYAEPCAASCGYLQPQMAQQQQQQMGKHGAAAYGQVRGRQGLCHWMLSRAVSQIACHNPRPGFCGRCCADPNRMWPRSSSMCSKLVLTCRPCCCHTAAVCRHAAACSRPTRWRPRRRRAAAAPLTWTSTWRTGTTPWPAPPTSTTSLSTCARARCGKPARRHGHLFFLCAAAAVRVDPGCM